MKPVSELGITQFRVLSVLPVIQPGFAEVIDKTRLQPGTPSCDRLQGKIYILISEPIRSSRAMYCSLQARVPAYLSRVL
jgi:hypothetical protein